MISIITVSYKSNDYVARMLASLFAHTRACDVEVLVVINGDGSDSSELEAAYPNVRWIKSERNLGFAGGCNLAITQATGDYLLLVNPDVVFTENAVCAIAERMDRDVDVGIGGISLKNLDGTQQESVRRFPTVADQLLILLKVPHLFSDLAPIRRYLMKEFDYGRTQDVNQVMGAFFCIRRALIENIGPLDDGFFIWYEEVDLCKRAVDAGWKVRYYADISALHRGGGSFSRVGTFKKQAVIRRSLRRYLRKHEGFGAWLLFVILNPLFILLAALAALIKPR